MIVVGDALTELRKISDDQVQACVTSPPYWGLRDYGVSGQVGIELDFDNYITRLVEIFREVRRVLRADGTLWMNLGDSYCGNGGQYGDAKSTLGGRKQSGSQGFARFKKKPLGVKRKELVGIPWRVALALSADGWYLRQDIIWQKPNAMPESVRDRCTGSHEYFFLLSKSPRYFFDYLAIQEPAKTAHEAKWAGEENGLHTGVSHAGSGKSTRRFNGSKRVGDANTKHGDDIPTGLMRNKRSVWTVSTKPFKGAHFATFPPDLIEPCVLAGSRVGDTILDPFAGAGTTWLVSEKLKRKFIGIELNPEYAEMAMRRVNGLTTEQGCFGL